MACGTGRDLVREKTETFLKKKEMVGRNMVRRLCPSLICHRSSSSDLSLLLWTLIFWPLTGRRKQLNSILHI